MAKVSRPAAVEQTVLKWSETGRQVTYVLLTSGDKGSHDPDLRPGQLAARRESEQRAAAADLGVGQVVFLRHPDGILENTFFFPHLATRWFFPTALSAAQSWNSLM